MSRAHDSEGSLQRRRYFVTPDRLLVGLLAGQGLLWISERFGWLGLGDKKGWPVLFAVVTVFLAVVITLLCFAVSARFRSHFQYRMRSLLLLILAAAIPCGWLSIQMQGAKRQQVAVKALLDAGGSVNYRAGSGPDLLRRRMGDDFFSDIESASAAPSDDPFDAGVSAPKRNSNDPFDAGVTPPKKNAADPPKEFNEDTLLQMTKGLTDVKTLDLSKTPIDDAALVHLRKFGKLEYLHLHETQVTDAGLVHLKGLEGLRGLWLNNTRIQGSGLGQLKDLPNLESINLDGTPIHESKLKHLLDLVNIEILSLDNTQFTDAGFTYLSQIPRLRALSLEGTRITDAGLKHLARLTELESLNLRRTGVGET